MQRVWDGFLDGKYFKIAFFWILRVVAVVAAIAGLFYWIGLWIQMFRVGTVGIIIGGIVDQGLYIIALAALVWTIWQRGGVMLNLPEEAVYPVFDITAVILRLFGEILAIILSFISIAGMIIVWGGGRQAVQVLGFLVRPFGVYALNSAPGVFGVGLIIFIVHIIEAIGVLLLAYFLAEAINMLKGIFVNTLQIQKAVVKQEDTPAEE
jgi:hypothetical protein